jgi:hypothetical protein
VVVQAGVKDPSTHQPNYLKTIQAAISQQTLGANLPNETAAPSGLLLGQVPSIGPTNGLLVDWGPVISYDTTTFSFTGTMDSQQYPRKFSVGNITGSSFARSLATHTPNTDQKEYWANASLGFPATVDLTTYQGLAQSVSGLTAPTCTSGNCTASPANSGYFPGVLTDTATFDSGWTPPSAATVLYINGNASFGQVAMDLKNYGAVIVNGNLILGNPNSDTIGSDAIRVPLTALQEYYYNPARCPCSTAINGTCTKASAAGSPGQIQFRGFLYVTGNLILNGNHTWVLNGVVRVDGTIQVPNGSGSLHVLYDDEINHNIYVTPLQLTVDAVATLAG